MNLMLHGIESMVDSGDTLSPDGGRIDKADLILTNPPFGTKKGGGRPTRSDFSITADTSNKQLAFVEHIVRALKPGGRAAVVIPDNVLFDDSVGRRLRNWMMELCDVHTILRLPTGIFYAQGVKTNVGFLTRGKSDKGNTKGVWVYDMRANMDAFGKSKRKDDGDEGRFRFFSRGEINARNDNLDLAWLRDTSNDPEDEMTEPEELAAAISTHLKNALEEIEAFSEELPTSNRSQA
jgi:type I restriction enzyme M protein